MNLIDFINRNKKIDISNKVVDSDSAYINGNIFDIGLSSYPESLEEFIELYSSNSIKIRLSDEDLYEIFSYLKNNSSFEIDNEIPNFNYTL